MRTWTIAAVLACAASAAAEPIAVRVTELAGGVAYVTPGRAAGLVPGAKVRMRGRELVVLQATEKTAALRLDGATVEVGEAGTADVDREAATAVKALPRPRPEATFTGKWPAAVHPAETQTARFVPLGSGRLATGREHLEVIGNGYGVLGAQNSAGDGELRVIASFDVLQDRPLAVDADVAARVFSDGYNSLTRTPFLVRVAQLRYGDAYDPTFALGRLRFAASSVGMLDGGRVAAHVGNFELAAFGGLLPDPVSGKPSTDASRFGTELVYDDIKNAWQPRVAVIAEGSTWMSQLDERRLSVVASANRDTAWLDGWAEAQQFPANNPWNAHAVELTGAGATAEWRDHGSHAGIDLTFLRPERSLRLDAALPQSWLCTLEPQPGIAPEACSDDNYYESASASAGTSVGRITIDGIGTIGNSHGVYRGVDGSGYVHAEVRVANVRVIAGASGGYASFATWAAAEVGAAASLARRLDAQVTYRPELLDYNASAGPELLHSLVFDGRYAISSTLDVAGSALATTGADRDAIALLATFVWRPLP